MSKTERTKDWIIEKTSLVFNTKGYAGTSLTDMTEITGLTKGSIYGNFKNKDEVAIEAFKYNLKKMSQLFKEEIDKKASYREKLSVYCRVVANFDETRFPRGGCPILNTAIESDDTHPELRKLAKDALAAWEGKIIEIIEKGIHKNEFKPNVDTKVISITMIALIEGAIMIGKLTGDKRKMKMIMSTLSSIINNL